MPTPAQVYTQALAAGNQLYSLLPDYINLCRVIGSKQPRVSNVWAGYALGLSNVLRTWKRFKEQAAAEHTSLSALAQLDSTMTSCATLLIGQQSLAGVNNDDLKKLLVARRHMHSSMTQFGQPTNVY